MPLDWYHSTTFAQFPDETHNAIKRIFNTPSLHPALPPTRRQFCGFCGTHLTAWNELTEAGDCIDVTLGSLLSESMDRLEALNILPEANDDDDEGLVQGGYVEEENHIPRNEGLVRGGYVDEEDHIPTNEESMGGVEGPDATGSTQLQASGRTAHRMQSRGMPYFEEIVENSRLGRIKRQKGGHTSQDGMTTVQWEVVEMGGDDESMPLESGGGEGNNKRQKMDA